MKQEEIEKVYLIKKLPADLNKCKKMIIRDGNFFDPNTVDSLRIRQKGNQYELTKKDGKSAQQRTEHTINIKKEEFEIFWPVASWKYEKERYLYSLDNLTAEIDIYLGNLKGYARVEVEFATEQESEKFNRPDWFGLEITDWNHTIHSDIDNISFQVMQKRYQEKGIELIAIN
ncbi:CYTH domain-containing protein [Patescibacteria group bacterium]|nr:CYTH domain-containing protein [Patescibacteria group bacterium]